MQFSKELILVQEPSVLSMTSISCDRKKVANINLVTFSYQDIFMSLMIQIILYS